jgi:hypothetical protein
VAPNATPAPDNVVYPGLIPTPYAPALPGYYDPTVSSPCNPANGSATCTLSDPNALPIAPPGTPAATPDADQTQPDQAPPAPDQGPPPAQQGPCQSGAPVNPDGSCAAPPPAVPDNNNINNDNGQQCIATQGAISGQPDRVILVDIINNPVESCFPAGSTAPGRPGSWPTGWPNNPNGVAVSPYAACPDSADPGACINNVPNSQQVLPTNGQQFNGATYQSTCVQGLSGGCWVDANGNNVPDPRPILPAPPSAQPAAQPAAGPPPMQGPCPLGPPVDANGGCPAWVPAPPAAAPVATTPAPVFTPSPAAQPAPVQGHQSNLGPVLGPDGQPVNGGNQPLIPGPGVGQ